MFNSEARNLAQRSEASCQPTSTTKYVLPSNRNRVIAKTYHQSQSHPLDHGDIRVLKKGQTLRMKLHLLPYHQIDTIVQSGNLQILDPIKITLMLQRFKKTTKKYQAEPQPHHRDQLEESAPTETCRLNAPWISYSEKHWTIATIDYGICQLRIQRSNQPAERENQNKSQYRWKDLDFMGQYPSLLFVFWNVFATPAMKTVSMRIPQYRLSKILWMEPQGVYLTINLAMPQAVENRSWPATHKSLTFYLVDTRRVKSSQNMTANFVHLSKCHPRYNSLKRTKKNHSCVARCILTTHLSCYLRTDCPNEFRGKYVDTGQIIQRRNWIR